MNKIKDKQSLIINVVIFAAILIFLNLVSLNFFKRLDFSDGQIYTLSNSSKSVVKQLDDRLVAKAYFSKNLPGQYADTQRFARDLLAEYEAYSKGKMHFEFVSDEKVKEEAQKNRIQPVRLQVLENDKVEVREVYMGIAFFYQDKSEVIPLVQNTRGLEYDITSTIKKITSIGLTKVAFFQGEEDLPTDPRNPETEYQSIRELIGSNYEMRSTTLEEPVGSDINTLVFAGVKDSLSFQQLFNFDQFVMSGRKVLIFQDRIDAVLQEMRAEEINSNVFQLLNHYGIYIKNNLVQDAQCTQIGITQRQGIFMMQVPVKYPFFPLINTTNKDNPIVANLEQLLFIFTSELDSTMVKDGQKFTPLLMTSKNSAQAFGNLDINYMPYMNVNLMEMFTESPKVVAGLYSGSVSSFFAVSDTMKIEGFIGSTDKTEIIVVADGDFIKKSAGGSSPSNLDFALNSIDYLSGNQELVSLRSRETEFRPLKELSNSMRKTVKWLNILLPALLLVLYGILRYRSVLAKREMVGKIYE